MLWVLAAESVGVVGEAARFLGRGEESGFPEGDFGGPGARASGGGEGEEYKESSEERLGLGMREEIWDFLPY